MAKKKAKRKRAKESQIRRRPGVPAAERGVAFWEGLLGLLALLEPRGAVDRQADEAAFIPSDWFAVSQQGFDSPREARRIFEKWVAAAPEGVLVGDGGRYVFKPSAVGPGFEAALAHLKGRRRKKSLSKKRKRQVALADANRKSEFWIWFEEFVRFLDFDKGSVDLRHDVATFPVQEWIDFAGRGKPGSRDTVMRRFERWKQKLPKGFLQTLTPSSTEEGYLYRFKPSEVAALARETVDRRDFFLRATGRATPYGEETPLQREASISRTVPIKTVLLGLGVPYSGAKAKRWVERLGMPVRIEKRGRTQKTFYYADSGEVFDWIQDSIREGRILDPFADKMPVEDARPRVKKALSVLTRTASKTQIAKLVGSNAAKLDSYIRDRVQLKFIPTGVVLALEKLVKEGLPDLKRSVPKAGAPTLVEIKAAIAAAKGNLTHAEAALRAAGFTKAITASNLSQIAKRYGIPVNTRRVIEPSKKEVAQALKDHDYLLTPTAASFGFSVPPLQRLIDKYGLRGLVDRYGMGKITKEDVVEAAEAGGFATVESAKALGVERGYFRDLLGQHNLVAWFDAEHEEGVVAGLASERSDLEFEIEEAVRLGRTRKLLARRLGMTKTRLESRVKILGLQKEYRKLSYDRAFKGKRERDIAPEQTRVPFWLAGLRDLRARYPGRGGGRKLAAALGYGNATISNWLSGKRVPGFPQIERIMSEAGLPMPDWRAALLRIIEREGSKAAAARKLGVAGISNTLAGRVTPSEKLLQRILGHKFWVEARVQPDTGRRPGASMGEVPSDVASTHLATAMVRLLGTVRSQRELAGLLGVSPASISRFMRAKVAAPPPRTRDAIVALYEERFGEPPPGIQTQHSGREALERALKLFPTQTALAEELGIARGLLSRIARGHNTISPRMNARILELLKDMEKQNPPRRFDVRSPAQGLRAIRHPVITKNYEKALRVKPKHKKAVLVPCAGTKPFPDAPSHKHGYLEGLKGKKLDVYVVSEPLGVVPYEWSRKYPQESYDFPPHHLRGPGRDLLVDRIADWFERGPRYEKVYLALPGHHRRLVLQALEQFDYPPTKIKDVGLGACLESGSCPPGFVRPTTKAYRKFLKTRANPAEGELGECYQDALNYITRQSMTTGDVSNLRLVHATVTGQGPIAGVAHGHAWVEEIQPPPPGARIPPGIPPEEYGTVWAIDRDFKIPAAMYRFMGKARDVKSYTYAQARKKASKYKHFGPWPGAVIRPNPPPRTAGLALFGREREPVEVVRPAWSGDVGYWDVVFEDGSEGTVSEIDLYTTTGERWRAPVRKPGRQAWTNNPFGLTYGQIAGKVVGWTATGAVADVITSRINRWITHPVTEAAEGAIVRGARAVVGKNPRNPSEWKVPPQCDPEGTGRKLDVRALKDQKVRVHVNLHNGCYTVSHRGRVAGYAKAITLKDVVPKVGTGGWGRCQATKVRNVHAYLEGTLVSAKAPLPKGRGWAKISYNCKTHPKPEFFYESRKQTFEGAQEVRLVRKKGIGMAQIEVWAKGRVAQQNPSCCGLPGGACDCGEIERWWLENPNEIAPCGSPPKQVGVHVVDRPWGRALLVLDASNLKAYTAKDWAERGRCPLLAAFSILDGEGAGTRVARDSMHDELAHHEASDRHYHCQDLAQLAHRCGIPLAQAEDLLCQEGVAWHHATHGSASSNP